jgi:hypothetical protein
VTQRADGTRPIRVIFNAGAGKRRLPINRPDAAGLGDLFEHAGVAVEVCEST